MEQNWRRQNSDNISEKVGVSEHDPNFLNLFMKPLLPLLVVIPAFALAQAKEIKPTTIRTLDINNEDAARFEKEMKAYEVIIEKLNKGAKLEDLPADEQKLVNETDESAGDYWDILGNGCSWYCGGGPDKVTASSELKGQGTNTYNGINAHDLSYKTAWVEGVAGYGEGQFLKYEFVPESPRITDIIVVNGYVKSEKAYLENSRVKKLKMYVNDKPYAILDLEDKRSSQTFTFQPIGNGNRSDFETLKHQPRWTLKFEILEVYKGSKYDDVAITEIYFDGLDVH
jgi:hypothetical protein